MLRAVLSAQCIFPLCTHKIWWSTDFNSEKRKEKMKIQPKSTQQLNIKVLTNRAGFPFLQLFKSRDDNAIENPSNFTWGVSELASQGCNFTQLTDPPLLFHLYLSWQPKHLLLSYSHLSHTCAMATDGAGVQEWKPNKSDLQASVSALCRLDLCTTESFISTNSTWTECKLWLLVIRTH